MPWSLQKIRSLFSDDLAIDLGTSNTLIYLRGKGIVLCEPSIIAINQKTGEVEAVGKEAREMLGKTPATIAAIRPLKDGVIADFEHTEKMLEHFIRKAHHRFPGLGPRIVIGVPSQITQVEKRAVIQSATRARASKVYLVEQVMLAALGAGLPVMEPMGNMVVDIGGGTADVAVISLGGIVYSRSVRGAGNKMDEDIMRYVRRKHGLLVGERMAEDIKIRIGSASPLEAEVTMTIKGRDQVEGLPRTLEISDTEIREALADTVSHIIESVRLALEQTPPELSADIADNGVMLTGGGSLLKNLDRRLREETSLPVSMAPDPMASVVLGAGRLLDDFDLLRKICTDES